MKIVRYYMLATVLWAVLLSVAWSADWYVATNGPGGGATNWATATNNIQDAISLCSAGDTVWVSNGVYETGGRTNYPSGTLLTNRVVIDKAITVRSANNDPTNTIIKGASPNGSTAVRCVFMTNNSTLVGFTLTNGATLATDTEDGNGGGMYSLSLSAVISNCIITGNSAGYRGGGTYNGDKYNCTFIGNYSAVYGGGSRVGMSSYCTYIENSAGGEGGGTSGGDLYNCMLIGNSAAGYNGGSAYGTIYNCTYISNSTSGYGGGAGGGSMYDCVLIGNYSTKDGGGLLSPYRARNCLIIGNASGGNGGGGYGGSGYFNCTIVGNSAATNGGGVFCATILDNCIVYFNHAGVAGSNWHDVISFTNTCTTPAATNGVGNITNDPMFVANGSGYGTNHVAGNYRLRASSPCVNTGTNQDWMTGAVDLDGRQRIRYGTVDMGAYETIYNGTIYRFGF